MKHIIASLILFAGLAHGQKLANADGSNITNAAQWRTNTGSAAVADGLPSQATHAGKYLTTNGTSASWATVTSGTTYTAGTGITLPGNAITFSPADASIPLAKLGQSGATTNQIPKWNGSAWVPAAESGGGTVDNAAVNTAIATDAKATRSSLGLSLLPERHVVVGDSLSSIGSGSASTSWAAYWSRHLLNQRVIYTNLAVAGRAASTIDTDHATAVTPLSPATLGGTGILFTLCGTNDLGNNSRTGAEVIANLRSIWTKGRADGFKIVAFTITKSGGITAGEETYRLSVNTSIRGDSAYWDYLVDLDKILPNNNDTTYFADDNLHYNAAGGEFISKNVRQVVDGGNTFQNPAAMTYEVGSFSVPNGAGYTKIPYTADVYDRSGAMASGTFTAPVAGLYFVNCTLAVQNASTSIRWILDLYKNGASINARLCDLTSVNYMLSGQRLIQLAAGDTLEIYANHSNGSSITVNATNPHSVFQVFRVNAYP